MTAIAITTAFHVNTTSMPAHDSARPSGPRRPKSIRRISPVATGGMTSGSDTIVSTSDRPVKRARASSHASGTPIGSATAVAPAAVASENQVTCQTSISAGATPRE